jgi:hypothetical protein
LQLQIKITINARIDGGTPILGNGCLGTCLLLYYQNRRPDYIEALMLSTGQKFQEDLLQRNARRILVLK